MPPIILKLKPFNNKRKLLMAPPTQRIFFIFIIFMALLSVFFSMSKGSVPIAFDQLHLYRSNAIFQLRLNRTLTAFICGGLLTLSGVLMQLLLENTLADPYVLGISGGASLGTLILMLLGIGSQWFVLGAWGGALTSILTIVLLAKQHRWQSTTMLLIGIALASAFSAIMSLLLILSSNVTLQNMLYWLTGDLNNTTLPLNCCVIFIIGLVICLLLAPGMNILARGELEARSLGLATQQFRIALYLLSSLFTATAVSIAGSIGFIGLIIPHLTRRFIGFDHRKLIPTAALMGGSLLTIADTISRTIVAPTQLPVGILLAMIGVPIFIGLLPR